MQPVYVKSTNANNPYPLMRLVLVSFGTQVGFGLDLATAINALVAKGTSGGAPPSNTGGGGTPPTGGGTPPVLSGDLAAAAQHLQTAIDKLHAAQQSGDFKAQGDALADLEAATKEFNAAVAKANAGTSASPSPSPSPTG